MIWFAAAIDMKVRNMELSMLNAQQYLLKEILLWEKEFTILMPVRRRYHCLC